MQYKRNTMLNHLLQFTCEYKETIWGGHQILPYKGEAVSEALIGESWELCGLEGHVSRVIGGIYDGMPLNELIAQEKEALVGEAVWNQYGTKFPLLVKFIDAAAPLSVQVHPDDELSMKRHGNMGKNEMWYIVRPTCSGASLLNGFSHSITPEEYQARVADNTLEEVLQKYEVHQGDIFYLPSGRVHSIGKGCLICEIQQSCDITYRIYDYGRVDAQGKQRELHVDLALEAIDFTPTPIIEQHEKPLNQKSELVRTSKFTTSVLPLSQSITLDYSAMDSFVILVCTDGACTVRTAREEVTLHRGHTLLIAAACNEVKVEPLKSATLLESYI